MAVIIIRRTGIMGRVVKLRIVRCRITKCRMGCIRNRVMGHSLGMGRSLDMGRSPDMEVILVVPSKRRREAVVLVACLGLELLF